MRYRTTIIGLLLLLITTTVQAQIIIGGNVYGGGNQGNVNGSTKVTVRQGDLNKVFGGARMANVGGNAYVNIDGANALEYIIINYLYGGNDIAGTIGTAAAVGESLPTELEGNPDDVDDTWNTYVHLSTKTETVEGKVQEAADAKKVFIGQVFAGGNGDFDYAQTPGPEEGKVTHRIYNRSDKDHTSPLAEMVTNEGEVGFQLPELNKTYLDIQGGTIFFAYGGGNNATVIEKTVIHVDNPSKVVTEIKVNEDGLEDENGTDILTANDGYRIKNDMGVRMAQEHVESDEFQIGRLFGGNNQAEMAIRPTWNLQSGMVRNLYSGGNRGNMTSPEGLLLEIKETSTLVADNVYGGCRMADVKPTVDGVYEPCPNLQDKDEHGNFIYKFPNELSARVLIRGGDINNVYGGNDVTGRVYGGNAIGIYTTIRGDVYGGGNGAYAYTDSWSLKDDDTYGDFYFETPEGMTPFEALNAFRPNAEQVSIRLAGTSDKPTLIKGSVFVGGNCASLATQKSNPMVELKMGSFVVLDKLFMGNNGEKMIDPTILTMYNDGDYFSQNLTSKVNFDEYMKGVTMDLQPSLVFDSEKDGDPATYEDYSSYVGSFYCGGNVGSMAIAGKNIYKVERPLNIFEKFVGGCNNADVPESSLNAFFAGGILGSEEEQTDYTDGAGNIKDRLEIDLNNLTITPLRWNDTFTPVDPATLTETAGKLVAGKEYYETDLRSSKFIADGTEVVDAEHTYWELTTLGDYLEWNTVKWSADEGGFIKVKNDAVDPVTTRLLGGNVYGGCYDSGHVNGNVVVNINADVLKKDEVFGNGSGPFNRPASGVDFEKQRNDVMAVSLTVFGAGCGEETEIWGSTSVNHNNGYVFQIFGGGEEGVVGKREFYAENGIPKLDDEGKYIYKFDPRYSTTVNLNSQSYVYSHDAVVEDLAETEFIYGGGNEGDVCGNTLVNLGNGRIYDAFGGASDADILGHAEVYIGRQPDGSGGYKDGFPWIKDIVYGGNDFGGTIHGEYEDGYDFTKRLRDYATDKTQLHGYRDGEVPDVLKSSTYVEYALGRVDTIFGGGYGYYDYNDALYGGNAAMPKQHSSFVNVRPKDHSQNALLAVFGGGTGHPGNREDDGAQDRSYVLIDIPDDMTKFSTMEAFGSGSYNGLGMRYTFDVDTGKTVDESGTAIDLDDASAIVDLLHGRIHNAYGGSYNEGITRRTVVNVPEASSIQIDSIYGGAYGTQILPPCDVYETHVNYKNSSENAQVFGAIFGGNNNERRSLFTQVNISSPVWSNKAKGYTGTVYGAGRGIDTWSEYTEVNLLEGAKVYNVYGGGEMGHVLNSKSIQVYMQTYKDSPSQQIRTQDPYWKIHVGELTSSEDVQKRWAEDWTNAWTVGNYYTPNTTFDNYAANTATNLDRISERPELDDKTAAQLDGKKYNTNVIINQGAIVEGYAYGGGLGKASEARTGDVYGNTYVAVLGGEVKKDVYGGGRAGGLDNLFEASGAVGFVATANVYVEGGTARNVYGGGYEGHVGHHEGEIYTSYTNDRPAESYVVIGKTGTTTYEDGAPAITRNVYGGGEGGSVYGTSHVTLNNGYIGYRYKDGEYVEELDDKTTNDLELSGNIFGGGYVINSYVDITNINMYGGKVRGSLYGGGEIGPIGRGTVRYKDTYTSVGLVNGDARIFKAGQTHIKMYNGHVLRNVFGGGRGKDSWGGDGTMYMDNELVEIQDMKVKGYVFGQTDVNIYGGEIGTHEGLADGYGNVFGGGDEGFVYSAYEQNGTLYIGEKPENSVRYDKGDEGYYYKSKGNQAFVNNAGTALGENAEKFLTEDCHVLIEPWLQVKTPIPYNGHTYETGEYIPTSYLNTLPKKEKTDTSWPAEWNKVDAGSVVDGEYVERGVIIHNAVFAGGNIAVGSELYANTKTVFGNATASIHDVYNRDLITVGGIHIGGLYGDGNLTFVDGYRELNVTNYGTDYYNISDEIEYSTYQALPPREKAYYELKYKCIKGCTDNEGTIYHEGSTIPQDELLVLFAGRTDILDTDGNPKSEYWKENGVVSRYAGRYLNTIQRADFCGVFGSRMVMKGAKDRVPEVEDATNYTINRVREVSLNKKRSVRDDDIATYTAEDEAENPDHKAGTYKNSVAAEHGNYFGIYSVVNYLGALTSDLNFYNDVRTTDNKDHVKYVDPTANGKTYGTATYADWKMQFHKDPRRNNGLSHNEVALASGVHLELTTEESTGNTLDTKEWGIITGIVQLDLINVAKGIGGGFVYAKNIHGVRNETGKTNSLLSDLNLTGGPNGERAITNRKWRYVETDDNSPNKSQEEWQTSGNFVHNTQTIIDDCYNVSGRYLMSNRVPAHYWFIRGSVYVYDQYITAQTGAANAYTKNVELPITISAAAHNQMKLLDVRPNLYAYYSKPGTPLSSEQKLLIQDNEYYLNTPISYWDWYLLSATEKNLFVPETYVTSEKCKIGNEIVQDDLVLLPDVYSSYERAATTQVIDGKSVKAVIKIVQDKDGNDVVARDKNGNPVYVPFASVFHSSNEMSHDTGYLLTYKMTNPKMWDTWYTNPESTTHEKSQTTESWENGPTYYLNTTTGTLLGQHEYKEAEIIPEKIYTSYTSINSGHIPNYGLAESDEGYDVTKKQAEFSRAYVVTAECSDANRHYYKGAPVSETIGTSDGVSALPAYVCTGTIQLSATEYIFINDLMTEAEKTALYNRFKAGASEANAQIAKDISELIVPAYYCTSPGLYGGNYYEANKNYRALEAWSAMSESDRANFTFNYDAFDLLIDKNYGGTEGQKYQYDNATTLEDAKNNFASFYTANDPEVIAGTKEVGDVKTPPGGYSVETPIDYTATFDGTSLDAGKTVHVKHASGTPQEEDVRTIVTGDILERDVYESLLNEQYHYAPIEVDVSKATKYYVVNTAFYYKEPYAAGQIMDADTYNSLPNSTEEGGLNYQRNVDVLTFSVNGTYYYCRDSYTIEKGANGGKPVKAVIANGDIAVNSVKNPESTVPVGFVISQEGDDTSFTNGYKSLINKQLGFSIHGVSPMETSTLYVSRDAKFDDLSKEKIITVIYQYDYEESDESGAHITPISERHVVRIHVTFEDGIPTVEDIREPDIVLPGNSITMRVPGVNSNGYEIIGGGWELFETKEDAESHFSGKEYIPSSEPLYWYQDDFYIAYYAKTYNRGKTYSNSVPVHVANYHDLKRVMDDKTNHLHVDYDRTRLKRDSKIYINDYSGSSQNGLDLFKDFYNLSVGTPLADHTPLNISTKEGTNKYDRQTYQRGVKAGQNLEFFLRTDIDHTASSWTSIGTDDVCFKGTLHGDGHTISGLDNSLFYNLCGDVYNLGVTGSFNSAGVVDKGTGYVESAWVKTTATTPLTTKPNAVFGNPTDNTGYQVVNSYFLEDNKDLYANVSTNATTGIIASGGDRGTATAKSAKAFYNGELAYDLNNFYLYKRYSDEKVTSGNENQRYSYFTIGDDRQLTLQNNHYYSPNAGLCSTGHEYKSDVIMYVEDRFADGDFRYAAGEIPTSEDERFYSWTVIENGNETVKSGFFPIWPDDYIFFGQKLTYGWGAQAHQKVPTAVLRDGGRLSDEDDANRVYRAPAYYRNSTMDVVFFNPHAYLAQTKKNDTSVKAYPGMTAIDFRGHYYGANASKGTYGLGNETGLFYTPVLDDDGLTAIENCDETLNLLVYAPTEEANAKTFGVLSSYFTEPVYDSNYDNSDGYRRVGEASTASIHGHLVQSDLIATNDHLLVDKEDFNAPLAYAFDDDHLMWYQRKPADSEFVDIKNGWQGISIPFTAELVTTDIKGEITHFYSGSEESQNGTKKGHEYWLREFHDIITEETEGETTVAKGAFLYPNAAGTNKTVNNTFLWDYYYKNESVHDQKDKNDDTYLQYRQYYNGSRTYTGYPLLSAGTPYIIGLPGQTYYEFDLSGKFEAKNTAEPINTLGKQTITFASNKGEHICVSDDETTGKVVKYGSNNYTFKPSYMNESLAASSGHYALNAEGNCYGAVTGTAKHVSAFRPYFTTTVSNAARQRAPERIVFGGDYSGLEDEPIPTLDGGLEIRVKDHRIIATSHLKEPVTVCVLNVGGITLANYVLQPGETQETRVQNTGVYIVNKRKVLVK